MYGIVSPGSGRSHVLSYMVTDHFVSKCVTLLRMVSSRRSVWVFAKSASRMPVPGEVHTARHGGQRQDRKGVSGAVSTVCYGMCIV
jgi:hypothetical protein